MPQYFQNDLPLVPVDKDALQNTLNELTEAIQRGFTLINANSPPPDIGNNQAFGSIYTGDLGVAIMAIRIIHQVQYLSTDRASPETLTSEAQKIANIRVNPHAPLLEPRDLERPSPLGSKSLGAIIVRILAALAKLPSHLGTGSHQLDMRDIASLCDVASFACEQTFVLGNDEVLYGRAGLLQAILKIRAMPLDQETISKFLPLFEKIPNIVNAIIQAGKIGATDFINRYGEEEAMPLMWPWHDKYYIGAIHGSCGILSVLLSCTPEELGRDQLEDHHPIIAETINALCELCIENKGHLPSSLPQHPSPRSPLVQICHGTPGLLILLSHARSDAFFASNYWDPIWDQAISRGTNIVWKQGLLFKGGGLCHGMAGNAWPFLILHDAFAYGPQGTAKERLLFEERLSLFDLPRHQPDAKRLLSQAITLLLHARKSRPFNTHTYEEGRRYRMPDAPYSLFEGLAGTICAWAEACVTISAFLRKMEHDESPVENAHASEQAIVQARSHELGFPSLT
ncbi:hypothetical protein FQN57_003818 [Myotisia sp. PD_48]|nr:hypothetical protein FQN57_003818 [Myotisia sp. PD_48]